MMMYSRNGGIDVGGVDAAATTRAHPNEWTLEPWIRPDGRPDVFIRPDWTKISVVERIALARSTILNVPGRHLIETAEEADEAISQYLAGTRHPGEANNTGATAASS